MRLACFAALCIGALALPASLPQAHPTARADALRLRGGWPGSRGKPAAPAAPAANAKGNSAAAGAKKAPAPAAGKTAHSLAGGKAAAAPARPSGVEEEKRKYLRVMEALTLLFPVWTVALALVALYRPDKFHWISADPVFHTQLFGSEVSFDAYSVLLGVIMLSIGSTLTAADFLRLRTQLGPLAVAWLLQYAVKPLLAFAIGKALRLHPAYATGLILLSCCPAAQAANAVSFIAGGDLATSMAVTLASTAASCLMTPLLFRAFAPRNVRAVRLDGFGMTLSLFNVIVFPTSAGIALNSFAPAFTRWLRQATPLVSVLATALLCAAPVAGTADEIRKSGSRAFFPVILLQMLSVLAGYLVPRRLLGLPEACSRSIAVQTGMQSAATGYLLATGHFKDVLVGVPSAVGVLVMSCLSSVIAVAWRLSAPPLA